VIVIFSKLLVCLYVYFLFVCLLICLSKILFSPNRRHWLTVHGTHSRVLVYDSMSGSASADTQATVRTLAGRGARITYCESCTQQSQPGDCGCFAAAYAATVVLGDDPGVYELNPDRVRLHLAAIVRSGKVTSFPYAVHCYCEGQAGGRMVACDTCGRWFHRGCLSAGNRIIKNRGWCCRHCRNG